MAAVCRHNNAMEVIGGRPQSSSPAHEMACTTGQVTTLAFSLLISMKDWGCCRPWIGCRRAPVLQADELTTANTLILVHCLCIPANFSDTTAPGSKPRD